MNKYLSQLVELVEIDKKIDSFEPEIEKINATLNSMLAKEQGLTQRIEQNRELLESNDLTIKKNEAHLKELSEKIGDLSKKSAAIKTEKEMNALQLEEEIAKEQIDFANEEIERLEGIKEKKEEEIAEIKKEIEEMKSQIDEARSEAEKELAELEKERMKVYENKQKLLSTMNHNIVVFYEKIRRWAGNTTVVPVKKQACYGCYMKINDHTYSQVIRGEEITTCPHCGRILYLDNSAQVDEENTQEEASA